MQYLSAPLTVAELDALRAQRVVAPSAQLGALTDITNIPLAWNVLAYLTVRSVPL